MAHNKYRTTDYSRRWSAEETRILMSIVGRKKNPHWGYFEAAMDALKRRGTPRTFYACHHRWRTVSAHVVKAADGKKMHYWTKTNLRKVKSLHAKGIHAREIAKRFKVTKYAIWHITKDCRRR